MTKASPRATSVALAGLDAPAPRWTTADRVYETIEQMVIAGRLRPGYRLTEISLAAQLAVSRTPLRQALQRLVSRGWVQRLPNGAIAVVDVSVEEIEALYAVRAALEELLLRQAAKRMKAGDLEALRQVLTGQDRATKLGDPELVSTYGERFHRMLWGLSANPVGIQFLEHILQRTTRYRRLSFSEPYRFKEGSRQHWNVIAALADGDVARACRVLRDHVDRSRSYVLQAFQSWRQGNNRTEHVTKQLPATSRKPRLARVPSSAAPPRSRTRAA